ncbi:SIS domain-containing protein [Roseibium album]|uniref:Glutamine--fructose-6-phosphate aminotransferase [isomerizing] n=1 Tax=Roseibium album TaxID=311410 RepID=A0A0M6ZL98_9HYPH|nr:SIS domain-containing protein [Roseibium album]CTQ62982.1 Glutamine--fructose-6-phosphate aminotransferase [isomerizing] [Roseibium album]CTQ79182.1 Glutamine--fructose-6-phosphate aminotransferase [isomerizing] [Roseibium album]CTQ80570.1 Glutamine--fructose-6-phosphate aminotransferase [isomerizing] [Roseibium album]
MSDTTSQIDRTHMRREIEEIPDAARRLLKEAHPKIREIASKAGSPVFLASVARGSSDHAASFLKYASEIYLGLAMASLGPSVSSVYGGNVQLAQALVISISQSGASPDILSVVESATKQGAVSVGLTNTADSPLARISSSAIDICAGPEKSVAATKTYVNSVLAGLLLLAEIGGDNELLKALAEVPDHFENAIGKDWDALADPIEKRGSLYVIGRGPGLAVANEAALKFKETCQIHAEAYSSAEVMHGPVSIVEDDYPVLVLGVRDAAEDGLAEAADRMATQGGVVFATTDKVKRANRLEFEAAGHPLTDAITQIVSFYAFIEWFARERGFNPDVPKHLKKVTQTV